MQIMRVHKGRDRAAFVGERYTAKIAVTDLRKFARTALLFKNRFGMKGALDLWNNSSADQPHTPNYYLLHGLAANRRERRMAECGDIVVPTRFLLKGVVNIQPTVQEIGLTSNVLYAAFAEQLGELATKLGHAIDDASNFGVVDGNVRFVDGGNRHLELFMQTQPESIRRALGALSLRQNDTE